MREGIAVELDELGRARSVFSLGRVRASFRPDPKPLVRATVVGVLETGLLFREDALALEDALRDEPDEASRYYLERGAPAFACAFVGACALALPLGRGLGARANALRLACYAAAALVAPALQRRVMLPRTRAAFLEALAEYTFLVRRCLAHLKLRLVGGGGGTKEEKLGPEARALDALLTAQQRDLCEAHFEAIVAFESHFASPTADFDAEMGALRECQDSTKIHHAFLLLQSTFLRNVGLAHLRSRLAYRWRTKRARRHSSDDAIYWMHSALFPRTTAALRERHSALERAYARCREAETRPIGPPRAPAAAHSSSSWPYSEVHAEVVACAARVHSALDRCRELDALMEACRRARSVFSPRPLEDGLLRLRAELADCFAACDATSARLRRMRRDEAAALERAVERLLPLPTVDEDEEQRPPTRAGVSEETRVDVVDQVFYCERPGDDDDDDSATNAPADSSTEPGLEETAATRLVLDELRARLVEREDEMRVREAVALENTMPEFKGRLPEFPRQQRPERLEADGEAKPPADRDDEKEGSAAPLPVEYKIGANLAIASLFGARLENGAPRLRAEETFVGDGEVSGDSGNED